MNYEKRQWTSFSERNWGKNWFCEFNVPKDVSQLIIPDSEISHILRAIPSNPFEGVDPKKLVVTIINSEVYMFPITRIYSKNIEIKRKEIETYYGEFLNPLDTRNVKGFSTFITDDDGDIIHLSTKPWDDYLKSQLGDAYEE